MEHMYIHVYRQPIRILPIHTYSFVIRSCDKKCPCYWPQHTDHIPEVWCSYVMFTDTVYPSECTYLVWFLNLCSSKSSSVLLRSRINVWWSMLPHSIRFLKKQVLWRVNIMHLTFVHMYNNIYAQWQGDESKSKPLYRYKKKSSMYTQILASSSTVVQGT